MKLDGAWVDKQQVVLSIRHLLDIEFNALGYEYITYELKKEYLINKKKVESFRPSFPLLRYFKRHLRRNEGNSGVAHAIVLTTDFGMAVANGFLDDRISIFRNKTSPDFAHNF